MFLNQLAASLHRLKILRNPYQRFNDDYKIMMTCSPQWDAKTIEATGLHVGDIVHLGRPDCRNIMAVFLIWLVFLRLVILTLM